MSSIVVAFVAVLLVFVAFKGFFIFCWRFLFIAIFYYRALLFITFLLKNLIVSIFLCSDFLLFCIKWILRFPYFIWFLLYAYKLLSFDPKWLFFVSKVKIFIFFFWQKILQIFVVLGCSIFWCQLKITVVIFVGSVSGRWKKTWG